MGFWSQVGDPGEPKRKYRWLAYIGDMQPWICKKVTKPEWEITESVHQYLNHEFYYPGRTKWSTVTVTMADPATPDLAQTFYNNLTRAGYHPPEDMNDTTTMSKAGAVNQAGRIRIVQLGSSDVDPGGGGGGAFGGAVLAGDTIIEEWHLYNAWVKKVTLGELDYSSDDMVEISVEFRYDYAKLNARNGDNPYGNEASQVVAKTNFT